MTVNLMDDGSVATISVLHSLFEASDVEFGIDALKLLADIDIAKSGFTAHRPYYLLDTFFSHRR